MHVRDLIMNPLVDAVAASCLSSGGRERKITMAGFLRQKNIEGRSVIPFPEAASLVLPNMFSVMWAHYNFSSGSRAL